MDYHKTFKLFKKIYYISITSEDIGSKIFSDIADQFLSKHKLLAMKMMKDHFNITFSDVKKIGDQIAISKPNGGHNYHYELQIKKKADIIKFLKSNLGTYERRSIK